MNKLVVITEILEQFGDYNFPEDFDILKEAIELAEYLIERSGNKLTFNEIDKCIFNRYEDYLY